MNKRLLVSFSGGETSAFMTHWILNNARDHYSDIAVVFANTGQENEQTLEFVRECDRRFDFGTVWIEAAQHHGKRKSASARVVDYISASRDGQPFEDMISKYGIPNQKFKHCTRDLKTNPINAFARDGLGWEAGSYDTAIGIRADEIDRQSSSAAQRRLFYPLIKAGATKPKINQWFSGQDFRLRLKGYQGNCKWCWKKSFRKHLTIIGETPDAYQFPQAMEEKYGLVGPEFRHNPSEGLNPIAPDYRRTFFRGNLSTRDLFQLYAERPTSFRPAEDDAAVFPEPTLFDQLLDTPGGCGDSCEVWSDDDGEIDELEDAAA